MGVQNGGVIGRLFEIDTWLSSASLCPLLDGLFLRKLRSPIPVSTPDTLRTVWNCFLTSRTDSVALCPFVVTEGIPYLKLRPVSFIPLTRSLGTSTNRI